MPVVTSLADPERKRNGWSKTSVTEFYKFECNRLISFQRWSPRYPVAPFALAYFGFFAPSPQETQCFACHKSVLFWKNGDDPFKRHASISPECPFLLCPQKNNIPLKFEDRKSILKTLNCYNKGFTEIFKFEENRLLSFRNNNTNNFPVLYGLAADGFFCINSNTVECFACHGRIYLNMQFRAVEIHDSLFKRCPIPTATPCGNRPIAFNDLEKFKQYFHRLRRQRMGETKPLKNDEYLYNLTVTTEGDVNAVDGKDDQQN